MQIAGTGCVLQRSFDSLRFPFKLMCLRNLPLHLPQPNFYLQNVKKTGGNFVVAAGNVVERCQTEA
jgi:hypothetical protein